MCMFVYGSVLIGFGLLLFPVNVFHKVIKIKSILSHDPPGQISMLLIGYSVSHGRWVDVSREG